MQVTKELILHLEELGRIELTEEERKKCLEDFQNILSYIETLNLLDTAGIEPLSHAFPVENFMREDIVKESDSVENILSNAPRHNDEYFEVSKTVESAG